jgi:transposase
LSSTGGFMELLHERCAGLDIGKKDLKACVRAPNPSGKRSRRQEIRTFATTTNALLELRDWLVAQKVTLVVMEATGDYWRGAFYLLEDSLNVILVNAAHAKGLPGRKTDVSDAAWLCQRGEYGLLKPSFVPPEPIRQLRDLTRYRSTLAAERTRRLIHKPPGRVLENLARIVGRVRVSVRGATVSTE